MASSSSDPNSLVDLTHCCFSIGEIDLVPTLEEYAELLQLGSPFSETPVIPIQGPRSNQVLEKYLGLTSKVLRLEICRVDGTWRKASISLDLLTKYFSWSNFPAKLTRDFIAGRGGPNVLHAASITLVLQSFAVLLPPLDPSSFHEAHSEIDCRYSTSFHRQQPRLGIISPQLASEVWGCTGYYPSLALRQFGGLQYPPRLSDLSLVTFDYVLGDDMWRFLSKGWSPSFAPRPTVRSGVSHPLVPPSLRVSAPTGQPGRVADLERELEEARAELAALHLARVSEREESAARVDLCRVPCIILEISEGAKDHLEQALAETQGQLEAEQVERTRVQDELDSLRSYTQALVDPSTGRPHDIVALQRALDESEASLTATRTSIGAMRVQISVLQGDNAVLLTEVDLVQDALASDASWLNSEGLPVVRALHEATQVVDSLGAAACTVLEGYDEGDPILSLALGRFCT
uniref:Aminotransferase-like plant mobile domain-containing protein n=1 Tax=Fagus sylvatica TaxID=28930 RepID=A0A2N9I882_FAGSY